MFYNKFWDKSWTSSTSPMRLLGFPLDATLCQANLLLLRFCLETEQPPCSGPLTSFRVCPKLLAPLGPEDCCHSPKTSNVLFRTYQLAGSSSDLYSAPLWPMGDMMVPSRYTCIRCRCSSYGYNTYEGSLHLLLCSSCLYSLQLPASALLFKQQKQRRAQDLQNSSRTCPRNCWVKCTTCSTR